MRVKADHIPESRLPFRIRDDYALVSFDVWEEPSSHFSARKNMKYAEAAKIMSETQPVADVELTSSDYLVLNILFKVCNMDFGLMIKAPLGCFNGNFEGSMGNTPSRIISAISNGFGGVGTTNTSRRINE